MYRIFGRRGTGKTKRLLEIANQTPGCVIFTHNPERLREKASIYGYHGLDIRSYGDYKDNYKGKTFVIDLEKFVNSITDKVLSGYTISED